MRGRDIPAPLYDGIFHVASGITQTMWGQPPTPEQMQFMHDQGIHEPAQVKAHYDTYPHPSAPHMNVGQYEAYKRAYEVYRDHR